MCTLYMLLLYSYIYVLLSKYTCGVLTFFAWRVFLINPRAKARFFFCYLCARKLNHVCVCVYLTLNEQQISLSVWR